MGALDREVGSLEEALSGAGLVILAVPVMAARQNVLGRHTREPDIHYGFDVVIRRRQPARYSASLASCARRIIAARCSFS